MNSEDSVGLIGIGLMGLPMARRLLAAGIDLCVYNRSRDKAEALAGEGATVCATAAELAGRCDIVILMLADTPTVETVLRGDAGVLQALSPGDLVVDMGTTAVTHVGDSGAGQIAKAANQVIVGLTIAAVAEGLALAGRAGADIARVREALGGGFADSRILEVHGRRMVDNQFAPGGRCSTQRKDLQQALDLAAQLGMELPVTALTRDLYDRLIERGDADLDHAALFRLYG